MYGHTSLALSQRVGVRRALLHSGYNDQTLANDIALLELSREVEFTEHVQPACLPTERFPSLPGATGIVAGWGYTSDSVSGRRPHQNPYLLFVTQTIMSRNFCVTKMQGYYYNPSTTFCAYRHGYDACQGDSGGSLMILHDDRWYSVGIISYGVGCATPGVPGIYTDVTKYVPWLRRQLQAKRQGP
ncbi:hypothetical protein V5799_027416 [Amblyomma americanum]|uniref:Peptidase S1 domain-containing protein n=1 Tax=Amblyomma americanum TaxID=6943 RepID=A0AAQ4DFS7_AMBAM